MHMTTQEKEDFIDAICHAEIRISNEKDQKCEVSKWNEEQLLIFYSSFLCVFVHIYFYLFNPSCSQKITTKLLMVVMEVKK